MQENAAPPRVGRDVLVAHERAVLERMAQVHSKCVSSALEGDRVAIHWNFELTDKSGKTRRFDEIAWQEWRGDRVFRERFFYDAATISGYCGGSEVRITIDAISSRELLNQSHTRIINF